VTQSVEHPAFDLSSRFDLTVMSLGLHWAPHWMWSLLKKINKESLCVYVCVYMHVCAHIHKIKSIYVRCQIGSMSGKINKISQEEGTIRINTM